MAAAVGSGNGKSLPGRDVVVDTRAPDVVLIAGWNAANVVVGQRVVDRGRQKLLHVQADGRQLVGWDDICSFGGIRRAGLRLSEGIAARCSSIVGGACCLRGGIVDYISRSAVGCQELREIS